MPIKVEVGPPQIAIHYGQTVLVTELDAHIGWPASADCSSSTRAYSAAEQSMPRRALGPPRRAVTYSSKVSLTPHDPDRGRCHSATYLGLVVSGHFKRHAETWTSPTTASSRCASSWSRTASVRRYFRGDGQHRRRGRITTLWSAAGQRLRTTYQNADFMRVTSKRAMAQRPSTPTAGSASGIGSGEAWLRLLYS